MKDIEA